MNRHIWKWLVFVHFTFNFTSAKYTQELYSGHWNVRDSDKVYNLMGNVPGGIYTDLMKNKIINDVFYRFNDIETRWVSKKDWTYSRNFTLDKNLAKLTRIDLIFDGVDTFSEIYLNDQFVGTTDNMFVRYIFDVKSKLKEGENYLEVRLKSPVNKAKELFDKQAETYPVKPLCVPDEYNGECHVNHIRKMQASFSWDWGPALPSMGIWKSVYMLGYHGAVIRDVTVKISSNDGKNEWSVETSIYLEADPKSDGVKGDFKIKLDTDDQTEECSFIDETITNRNEHGEFLAKFTCNVGKDKVQLWWPNGYGEAKLYTIDVSYTTGVSVDYDSRTFKIGYRTVELKQDEIKSGRKFYFEINSVPIFAKGTNSIPINILPERGQNEDTIRFLLQSAKDVHMNMIRVWGGGTYEADVFYKIADELGIMIWQDFMFACNMYPTDKKFLDSVKKEVRHQVRRLQYHPSIVLWAGNNENEAALRQNWYDTQEDFETYKADYKILYNEIIRNELSKNDNSRSYLLSSPTNGIESENEDCVAENPQSHFYGDVHFYNYNNDSWVSSYYPLTRFASEYGYQSLPSYYSLASATNIPEDLEMDSDFLISRQHLPQGYSRLETLINHQLHLPYYSDDLKKTIYYSQIIQAMAVKRQTEFYRQWRSSVNSEGKGYTMGALYWQLNDVWIAPTWSGIDFNNNWKMLHYYARDFFAPVIVTGDLNSNGFLSIYVVSDKKEEIPNAYLNIQVYKWYSMDSVHNQTLKINVPSYRSALVTAFSIETYFAEIVDKPCGFEATKTCFVYLTLKSENDESIAPGNVVFPLPLNQTHAQRFPPKIEITDIREVEKSKEFEIEITTDKIALFVWLETKPSIRNRFSDNGFIQVTRKKTIRISTELSSSVEEIRQVLKLSTLYVEINDQRGDSGQICFSYWILVSGLLLKCWI